jgi:hypothetical protein
MEDHTLHWNRQEEREGDFEQLRLGEEMSQARLYYHLSALKSFSQMPEAFQGRNHMQGRT